MEPLRKPYQGVWNIFRFNWHFYVLSCVLLAALFGAGAFISRPYLLLTHSAIVFIAITTFSSLAVSFYVYDLSGFYTLNWLNELCVTTDTKIVNINAGFDETSRLLHQKYPAAELIVFDFYDPSKHTEISIKRARAAYQPFSNTVRVNTIALPLPADYADYVFLIFAAHEIRDKVERIVFFKELKRIIKPDGKIIMIEHLRDVPNLLAYNIGFFHFVSKSSWQSTFQSAGLNISHKMKFTPFVNSIILEKYGSTA